MTEREQMKDYFECLSKVTKCCYWTLRRKVDTAAPDGAGRRQHAQELADMNMMHWYAVRALERLEAYPGEGPMAVAWRSLDSLRARPGPDATEFDVAAAAGLVATVREALAAHRLRRGDPERPRFAVTLFDHIIDWSEGRRSPSGAGHAPR